MEQRADLRLPGAVRDPHHRRLHAALPGRLVRPRRVQADAVPDAVLASVAGYQISWAIYVSDYSRYLPPDVTVRKTFLWTYWGSGARRHLDHVHRLRAGGVGGCRASTRSPRSTPPATTCSTASAAIVLVFSALGLISVTALNMYGGSLTLISAIDSFKQGAADAQRAHRHDHAHRRAVSSSPALLIGENFLSQLRELPAAGALPVHPVDRGQPRRLLHGAARALRDRGDLQPARHLRPLGLARDRLLPGRLRGDGAVLQHRQVHRFGRQGARRRRLSRCSSACRSPASSTGCSPATSTSRPRPLLAARAEGDGAGGEAPRDRRPARPPGDLAEHVDLEEAGRLGDGGRRPGRSTSSDELVEARAAPDRRRQDDERQRVHRRPRRAGAARRPRRRRPATAGAASRCRCAGVPVSVKDHIWLAGAAGHERLRRLRGLRARRRRGAGRPARRGRRDRRRQDQQPGVLLPRLHRQRRLRRHPQPVVARPDARRVERRRRRVGRRTGRRRSRSAPTAAGRSGSRRRSAAWSATSRRSGWCPKMPGFRGWPTLSVDGPLTRTVRDAALALSVMAGPSPPTTT